MKLHLNLDHLLVPGDEQRACHAAVRAKMFPRPRPKLVTPSATDELAAAIIAVDDNHPPEGASDDERVAWMARRYAVESAARPWEKRLHVLRTVGAKAFGCSVIDLIADDRKQPIVRYRMLAFAKRQIQGVNISDLGRTFGGRDHCTVLYAIDRFGEFVEGVLRREGVST